MKISLSKLKFQSSPIKNLKFLKQITALETVKFLYERGHLDEDLYSTYSNIDEHMNSKELFPHWKEEDENIKPGSANCFRTVPLKVRAYLLIPESIFLFFKINIFSFKVSSVVSCLLSATR